MRGGYLPYHLRQGKAVDRQLFIDVLLRMNRFTPIEEYRYVGLGGPFLEDFKLMHGMFGIEKMTSLEVDQSVVDRQEFNAPVSCVECRLQTTGGFVDEFSSDDRNIVWLDYASARERGDQMREIYSLASKLAPGDILKVTLNAYAKTLCDGSKLRGSKLNAARFQALAQQMGELIPGAVTADDMSNSRLPGALLRVLRRIAGDAVKGTDDRYVPVGSFTYQDGQKMLTLSLVRVANGFASQFFEKTGFDRWTLANTEWTGPVDIDVPALSLRERLWLDGRLPERDEWQLSGELGFNLGESDQESIRLIRNYRYFYRYYPQFSRVVT